MIMKLYVGNLSFETSEADAGDTGGGLVASQWVMRGTATYGR